MGTVRDSLASAASQDVTKGNKKSRKKLQRPVARELKIIVVVVQILLMLLGIAFVTAGVLIQLENHGMIHFNRISSDDVYTSMSRAGLLDIADTLTIVVGVGLFLLSFQGLIAVYRESKCMLALFMGGLVLALLVEGGVVGTSIAFTNTIDDKVWPAMNQGLEKQFEGHIVSEVAFSKALDDVQVEFHCCGLENYTDFKDKGSKWFDRDSTQVPKSCCHLDEDLYFDNNQFMFDDIECGRIPTVNNTHIEQPCYVLLKDWLEEKTYTLLGLAVVGAGFELLGLFVSTCLLRDVKSLLK